MKRCIGIFALSVSFAVASSPDGASVQDGAVVPVVASIQPSRFIAGAEQDQIALLRARIAINGKQRGPFGLSQNPDDQPNLHDILPMKTVRKLETPFVDVVRAVPVAAVFPAEQEFLVGSRTIRTGDTFPLIVRDQEITVRVESVHSAAVVFKNTKSGERASKRLDLLPEGITPGGKIQKINGLTPAGQASRAPLRIDVSSLPSTSTALVPSP